MMYIVMTSSAHMPSSCRGTYRRVAVVQLDQYFTANNLRPAMISDRAKGVLRVRDLGKHSVGKTERCAYARTLKEAEALAYALNNTATTEEAQWTWGGSA